MLNFSSFKPVKTANERANTLGVARGQNFKVKYRKFHSNKGGKQSIETSFYMSNDKFNELQLGERALIQLVSPEGVAYIATVDNENGTMMKRTDKLKDGAEKGKKFKSTILEAALLNQGIIEDKIGESQMLDLNEVGADVDIDGIKAYQIFEIVKGEDTRTDEEKAAEGQTETPEEEQAVPANENVQAEPVAESNTNASNTTEEDDF